VPASPNHEPAWSRRPKNPHRPLAQGGARANPMRHAPSGDDFRRAFPEHPLRPRPCRSVSHLLVTRQWPRPSAQPVKASDSRCGDVSFPSNGNSSFARPRRRLTEQCSGPPWQRDHLFGIDSVAVTLKGLLRHSKRFFGPNWHVRSAA